MLQDGAWKLIQRKLYSWLSSKCGLPVCIVGLLLVLISALQFGEVLVEWSKERYAVQFSVYADNVVGRSFERFMCPELPIDVVYTWVNGTDPKLLSELRKLKEELKRESIAANETPSTSNNLSNSTLTLSATCPFENCVRWSSSLVLDAQNLSADLQLAEVKVQFPALEGAVECRYANASGGHVTPVYTVRMPSEHQVSSLLANGSSVANSSGHLFAIGQAYLTTDGSLAGVVRLPTFALLLLSSSAVRPLNGSRLAGKLLRKWAESQFGNNVSQIDVTDSGIAIAKFQPGTLEDQIKRNSSLQFSGQPLRLRPAFLVWLPFSLPEAKEEGAGDVDDVAISASRFQDNEELRYSLRSIEKHAPWVRHIFIVTNGQIPSWLNLEHPRLTLVSHDQIFPNSSHLPSYSSPAIESHLHRIPGLSKHFLYLNDDVMFGDDIWPEDFYTPQRGQKVYFSWPVPHCADGCPPSWITDRYCDQACNNSACDWDGGDCANATHTGWQSPINSQPWQANTAPTEYCNTGCLNSWLGDRYCDQACRVPDCGYDAGDCGVERWEELHSIDVGRLGGLYSIPRGTKAMFVNLTELYFNGSISAASHAPSPLVRTAVVAQKFKTLSLTFARNVSMKEVNFTIVGKTTSEEEVVVRFNLTGETVTEAEQPSVPPGRWSFPNHTHSDSAHFLEDVAARIQDANRSVNYWITERPPSPFTPPPPTTLTNYTLTNSSLLPPNVSEALSVLQREFQDGDLTAKGFLRKKIELLEPFQHLLLANGSVSFGKPVELEPRNDQGPPPGVVKLEGGDGVRREGGDGVKHNGGDGVRHVELFDGGNRNEGGRGRRLLWVTDEDRRQADWLEGWKRKQLTKEKELKEAVDNWEQRYGPWVPGRTWDSRLRRLPWEKHQVFPDEQDGPTADGDYSVLAPHRSRRLLEDPFADSLRYVNRIFNKAYGYEARKVPAHMPHFINVEIMQELQERYPEEFALTSSHCVRHREDMQFSFSYFYFLMSEKREMELAEAFRELDTDRSGILSVRELRTVLVMVNALPIAVEDVEAFEQLLQECDEQFNGTRPTINPMEFETHYDPNMPLVTYEFLAECTALVKKLGEVFKSQHKYKFEELNDVAVAFKMMSENASKVMQQLDEIRKEKKKFICLNDNIDHNFEGAEMSKRLLVDFYESLFPIPSQFELEPQYRNRFLHIDDLESWLSLRNNIQLLLHLLLAVLLVLCVVSLFYGKVLQIKRRLTRLVLAALRLDRPRSPSV